MNAQPVRTDAGINQDAETHEAATGAAVLPAIT